jgi:hypothetical protein
MGFGRTSSDSINGLYWRHVSINKDEYLSRYCFLGFSRVFWAKRIYEKLPLGGVGGVGHVELDGCSGSFSGCHLVRD